MHIGLQEILLIAIVVILIVRPDKFPEYAKRYKSAMKELKNAKQSLEEDIEEVKATADDLQSEITETADINLEKKPAEAAEA